MREILFRGKEADTGTWVRGELVCYRDGTHYILPHDKWEYNCGYIDDTEIYEVRPETVGQFTERYDRNQVRIFEHDIVVYKNQRFVVRFDFGAWRIFMKNGYKDNLFTIPPCDIAVISNIHDTPDLFE